MTIQYLVVSGAEPLKELCACVFSLLRMSAAVHRDSVKTPPVKVFQFLKDYDF
jgi:hypothetical protein